jgi:hypothetical protein
MASTRRPGFMGIAGSLRKALKFFLMSLGISSPEKKPPPAESGAQKPGRGK